MSNSETRIFVQNFELLARIGIHEHEQDAPQPIRVNVWVSSIANLANDKLESTINYEVVAEKIRKIVGEGHINLAETLAERIAAACLVDKRVVKVGVNIAKLRGLAGAEAAGVEIVRTASKRQK